MLCFRVTSQWNLKRYAPMIETEKSRHELEAAEKFSDALLAVDMSQPGFNAATWLRSYLTAAGVYA